MQQPTLLLWLYRRQSLDTLTIDIYILLGFDLNLGFV